MFSLVNCPVKPSRTLAFFYAGVHLLALLYIFSLDVELFVSAILLCSIALIFLYFLPSSVLLSSADAVTALTWQADDKSLQLQLGGVQWVNVVAIRQKVVTPVFIYMLVDVEERMLAIPVVFYLDSCSGDSFRRLKVLVKFATLNSSSDASRNSLG